MVLRYRTPASAGWHSLFGPVGQGAAVTADLSSLSVEPLAPSLR